MSDGAHELAEDRRREIRLEEIFRDEVKKQLEEAGPNAQKKKIWKWLNEPFVLWVLSTILVGVIGWAYTQFQASWTAREENTLTIEKLRTQAEARFELAIGMLSKAATAGEYARAIEVMLYDNPMSRFYPEFKDRSTASIIWEAHERMKLGKVPPVVGFELQERLEALKAKLLTTLDQTQEQETIDQIWQTVKELPRM